MQEKRFLEKTFDLAVYAVTIYPSIVRLFYRNTNVAIFGRKTKFDRKVTVWIIDLVFFFFTLTSLSMSPFDSKVIILQESLFLVRLLPIVYRSQAKLTQTLSFYVFFYTIALSLWPLL